jgi:hypothetical protein
MYTYTVKYCSYCSTSGLYAGPGRLHVYRVIPVLSWSADHPTYRALAIYQTLALLVQLAGPKNPEHSHEHAADGVNYRQGVQLA